MAIRSTIAGIILDGPIRDIVEQILASRSFVTPGELQRAVNDAKATGGGGGGDDSGLATRIDALETELAALKKKQSMTMGAVQASTAQLMSVKTAAEGADSAAAQASQNATTAKATAEAAADGVSGVEERLDALIERIGTGGVTPAPAKKKKKGKKAASGDDRGCSVAGCEKPHRARGYCGKHYQMWKRGTLEASQ